MNKLKINYLIDVGLTISFFTCFITGLLKWPGLIKIIGITAYRTLRVENVSTLHDVSGLIMGLFVLIHLALHWNWIVITTKNLLKKKPKNTNLRIN